VVVSSYVDIDQHRLPNTLDLGDNTLEIKRFCQYNLEDLLHVDTCRGRAEDERGMHCFRESLCLLGDLLLLVSRKCCKGVELGSNKKRDSRLGEGR
jgi:hypothetical protein